MCIKDGHVYVIIFVILYDEYIYIFFLLYIFDIKVIYVVI